MLDIRVRVLTLPVLLLAAHVPIAALLTVAVLAPAFVRPVPDIPGPAAGLDGLGPLSALSALPSTALFLLFDPALVLVLLPDVPLLPTALPSVALSLLVLSTAQSLLCLALLCPVLLVPAVLVPALLMLAVLVRWV